MTYRVPGGPGGLTGVAGENLTGTGFPDQQAFVDSYCAHAGRKPPESLDVFVVFSMFRLASITAGVWRRGVDGNAADARASTTAISRALSRYGRDCMGMAQQFTA